jgi:hypothetical protein
MTVASNTTMLVIHHHMFPALALLPGLSRDAGGAGGGGNRPLQVVGGFLAKHVAGQTSSGNGDLR